MWMDSDMEIVQKKTKYIYDTLPQNSDDMNNISQVQSKAITKT